MTALALLRFAHFLAAMLAFGMSAYLWAYAPERLRLALSPVVRRLALIASLVALITAVAWLALESASMADDWSAAARSRSDRRGAHRHRLRPRVGVASRFSPRRWSRSSPSARAPDGAPTTLASAAVLASLGLVGHAAMQSGAEGVLHRANHAVHLLTAGAWIGGLVPFAMCLRAYERDDLRKDAVRAMAGFSFWGQFIVAAIVLTGVVNIALTSGRAPIPPTTPYRALLTAKIIIVGIMILIALFNRFVLAPATQGERRGACDIARDQRGGSRARLRRRGAGQRVCAARSGVKRNR